MRRTSKVAVALIAAAAITVPAVGSAGAKSTATPIVTSGPGSAAPKTSPWGCPDPARPLPNPDNMQWDIVRSRPGRQCWSLVASGDSITSAHIQRSHGLMCGDTTLKGNDRRGRGNAEQESYAWKVFNSMPMFAGGDHWNFARTGASTWNMVNGIQVDACDNPWAQTIEFAGYRQTPPFRLVTFAAMREVQMRWRRLAWVTTGGANDTNWALILQKYVECKALSLATGIWGTPDVVWTEITPEGTATTKPGKNRNVLDQLLALLLAKGGRCTVRSVFGDVHEIEVPVFTVTSPYGLEGLTDRVAYMVSEAIEEWIDKVVWVTGYDLSTAQINVSQLLKHIPLPDWLRQRLPKRLPTGIDVFSALDRPHLHARLDTIQKAICDGVEIGRRDASPDDYLCIPWRDARFSRQHLQTTVVGGMPHPNQAGHDQLAKVVAAAIAR